MSYIMRRFFNKLFFAFIIILLNIETVLTIAQSSDLPILPWDGKKVFVEKGCIQCHAIYGEGGNKGTDLGEDKFYGSYLDLAALMWNHFPEMYDEIKINNYKFY